MTLEFIRNALTIFQQFCCHIFILLHLIFVVADRFLSEFFCCSRRQWNPVGIPLTKSASFAFRWIGSIKGIRFVGYTKAGLLMGNDIKTGRSMGSNNSDALHWLSENQNQGHRQPT